MHEEEHDEQLGRRRRTRFRRARSQAAAVVAVALFAVLAAACGGGSSGTGTASGGSSSSSGNGTARSSGLAYSSCMRAHGLTSFPDPNSSGGFDISASSGINPNSPKYQTAAKACQAVAPGGGTSAQQQLNYRAELKYASCMQGRGIDIADPPAPGSGPKTQGNSGGGTAGTNRVNPNSPQFIAANKACQHYLPAGSGPSNNSSGGGS